MLQATERRLYSVPHWLGSFVGSRKQGNNCHPMTGKYRAQRKVQRNRTPDGPQHPANKGDKNWGERMMKCGRGFGGNRDDKYWDATDAAPVGKGALGRAGEAHVPSHAILNNAVGHEWGTEYNQGEASSVWRIMQHSIVSLQRQVDENGRRDPPQRCFLGKVRFNYDRQMYYKGKLPPNEAPWAELTKAVDTGYNWIDGERFTKHRDEVLNTILRHFRRRGARLSLVSFREQPAGMSLQLEWDEEDDARLLTPEGEQIPIPRVDPISRPAWADGTYKIGHGYARSAF